MYALDILNCLQKIRVLHDSGSQISLITKICVTRLSLVTTPTDVRISGISDSVVTSLESVSLKLFSRFSMDSFIIIDAFVVPCITTDVPSFPLDPASVCDRDTARLADFEWWRPGPVDILVGNDCFNELFDDCSHPMSVGSPSRLHTIFGDVLFGIVPASQEDVSSPAFSSLQVQVTSPPTEVEPLNELLALFR